MANLGTRGIVIIGLILIFSLAGGFVLQAVFYHDVEISFSIVIVLCVCVLLMMLLLTAIGFNALELDDPHQAFGLPDGSIRALLAILLVIIWVIVSLFLVALISGFYGKNFTPSQDGVKIAEQLYTTMSTLVVAISAFFFGSNTYDAAQRSTYRLSASGQPTNTDIIPNRDTQGASVGEAVIPAEQTNVEVQTTAVTDHSNIFVTVKGGAPVPLSVVSQQAGTSFMVEVAPPQSRDVKFSWWIVK